MLFAQLYYKRQKHTLNNPDFESLRMICTDGAYLRAIRDAERRKNWPLYQKIEKSQKKLVDLFEKAQSS